MFKRKYFLLIMILVLGLAITACGNDEPETDPDSTPVENKEDMGEDADDKAPLDEIEDIISGEDYEDITIMPEEAFDIFIAEYPDARVKEVKLEKELNQYIYKIEGYSANNEYELELKIDPFTGNILDVESEADKDDDKDGIEITRDLLEKVTSLVDEAIANSETDSLVKEWAVKVDDGIIELEIEIDQKGFDDVEYTYNLETGQLLELDD